MKKILSFILLLPLIACTKDVFPQDWVGHTFGDVLMDDGYSGIYFTESIEILSPTTAKITVRHNWKKGPEEEQRLSAIYHATREKYLIKLTRKPKEPVITWIVPIGKNEPVEPSCLYLYPVNNNIFGLDYCYKESSWNLKKTKFKQRIKFLGQPQRESKKTPPLLFYL